MSQYPPGPFPSPYVPPIPGADYLGDLLAPARRAGTLMVVLGALGLTCGFCFGISSLVPLDNLPPEQLAQLQELTSDTGTSLRTLMIVSALVAGIPSLAMLICGALVRKGRKAATWVSLIIVGIQTLLLVGRTGRSLYMAMLSPGRLEWVVDAGTAGAILALFALLMVWLIQAVRRADQIRQVTQQAQWQYWQYVMQQQQAYAQWAASQQQPPPPPPAHG